MARIKSTLWITDPWDTLDHARDTTLRLAQAGHQMGFPQYWADVKSIRLAKGRVLIDCRPLGKELGTVKVCEPKAFRFIHYRTDPPVDLAYLHPLQLLQLGLRGSKTEMVNPFHVLFSLNEKMQGETLPGLIPRTVVSSRFADLEAFGRIERRTVLKPLYEAQSKGIELLDWTTPRGVKRAREAWAHASGEGQRPILLQQFLPGIKNGETRLWFVDGRVIATVKKLPLQGDFRVNLDAGSKIAPTRLDTVEKAASSVIGKSLRAEGIRLAAVDLIDGKITDFNFTSPGLLTLMEQVLGEELAPKVMERLLGRG